MTKIVVTQPMGFSEEQKTRLEKLGVVKYHDDLAANPDEWIKRCEGANIICSGIFGVRDAYGSLKDVFISVPFVGVASFADPKVLKANNITLCNSPGSNRHAVSEWIIFMLIETMRNLAHYINSNEEPIVGLPPSGLGLHGKNVTILGKGNIGSLVGTECEAFEMNVTYFTRGDSLLDKVKDADVVIDCLTANTTTQNLLNELFFNSLKGGVIFISVTTIGNIDAMLDALDNGKLAAVAYDVMTAKLGDTSDSTFVKLRDHPKVYATPHIAGFSDVTNLIGNNMMIDNIEAWQSGKPINVFGT